MKKYDVFVIGSGMAGMNIANRCANKGLKVGVFRHQNNDIDISISKFGYRLYGLTQKN